MTTEEVRAAFGPRRTFARCRESSRLYHESARLDYAADTLWGGWWFGRTIDAEREAQVWQAVDILLRLSGLCALESARFALDFDNGD